MSGYEELAARRFRQYKLEMRKTAFTQTLGVLTLKVLQHAVRALEQAGLTRKRPVEKVAVE